MSAGGAIWLAVTKISRSDHRPQLHQAGGRNWGYHVDDINLALGNLVKNVKAQEAAYCAKEHQVCTKSTAWVVARQQTVARSTRSGGQTKPGSDGTHFQ